MDKGDDSEYNPGTMTIRSYILNQLSRVFLSASLVLYCVMFIVQLVRMGQVLSVSDMDIFLLALIPMATFVLPMALIFSILITLEKLSVESEVIAMKACGVSQRHIAAPILILAAVCMILHLGISTYLGPLSMQKIQKRIISKAPEKVFAFLKEREFINTFKDLTLYIESVNQRERKLSHVFIETKGNERSVITSTGGTLELRPQGIMMRLTDGSVFMESGQSLRYITFGEYNFFLDADFRRDLKLRSTDALTQPELKGLIRENRAPKHVNEYYSRFAFPFLNLILALVGLQFGIQKPRSPRNIGMILGIGTILLYYLAFLMTDRLVKGAVLNPTIGAWLPDLIFCTILFTYWSTKRVVYGKGGI